ncbi:MAG: sugar phosphate nucleotidyltransferase [Desulfurococcaceae archaeon]
MTKAILLAAGEGTRLRPVTETRPKSMIPVLCKPLLEWHLKALLRSGVETIYVVVSYMKDYIGRYLEARGLLGSRVKLIDQGEPRGTGDAVIKASEAVGHGEDVLVVYSDIFLSDWNTVPEVASRNGNVIVGVKSSNPREYGILYMKGSFLEKVVEKPEAPETDIVNAGIYKLNTSDILENANLTPSPRGEIELTDIVNRIASRKPITVLLSSTEWIDVGKPWHIIEANKIALRGIETSLKGRIIEPVRVVGRVFIDEDSTIYPYTTIEGPVYIGRKAEIGPNAYIRPWSVICDNSKIGFSVEVKESVLFENVHSHHLSYIGDSVICEDVNLGAGTVLANLRFDEKTVKMSVKGVLVDTGRRKLGAIIGANVKTGVNVSVMPGVKIGSGSWILPGTVVYRDVPSNVIYPRSPH